MSNLESRASSVRWSSTASFVFAAAAAAIGLGNIWRFPFLAGMNGGGAFVLIYLACVVILGLPLMLVEIILGRYGRQNPFGAFAVAARDAKRSKAWRWVGGLMILAGFLILSYYIVIAGWVLDYFTRALRGGFSVMTEQYSVATFQMVQDNSWNMLVDDTLLTLGAVLVIVLGVKHGLEKAVKFMFPALLLLMLLLLVHSMLTGYFMQGVDFLFKPDFSKVTGKTILMALGQAFFSLNVAMGITITFSAYLPKRTSLGFSAIAITLADTSIALLSGLIIFPIVFANKMAPAAGPSLIFKTLPIAFGALPWSNVIGALFFLMLLFAAFTSVISLLEVFVAWLVEQHHLSRFAATSLAGLVVWLLSLGTIGSFSYPQYFSIAGVSFFQGVDFVTAAIFLPLGGLLTAIFAGWFLPLRTMVQQLDWYPSKHWFKLWCFLIRVVAPIAIIFILLASLKLI